MNEPFIQREKECGELTRCMESHRSEFAIVYGRRRVGKTYLIENYFKGRFDFKFVGTREASTRTQLFNFARELKKYSGKSVGRLSTWSDAFYALEEYLETLPQDRKRVVFFDEMPWIDSSHSDFVRSLEYFWNSWAVSQRNIMFVATGSATSWMVDKIVANKGGLHGRITSRIHVAPFTLHETEDYLRQIGAEWDRLQIAQSYMLLGGVPFYYSLIDPGDSLAQNVDRLFFHEDGALRLEFDELYHALFKNADLYLSVVKLLCEHKGGMTNQEISKALNFSGGKLTTVLRNLERCDFIERWNQYGNKKRLTQFRMVDFFTLFYHKFVESNNLKDENWWSNNMRERSVMSWMGNTFEILCMRHRKQIKEALRIDAIGTSISAWRQTGKSDTDSDGAQIDMLIERADRIIHLCEMKFSENLYTISKDYELALRNRAAIFKEATQSRLTLVHTFVTTYGVKDGKHKSIVHSEVTMDDLFNA
ncbi:MAG: ATP-binding protein [Prevotella sp.]|nr:ATP-binding protein [Prevotella sp.]